MKLIPENHADYFCDINAPCFQALSLEEGDLVRSSKTQVQFRKGDNLTKQGIFTSYILFMIDGLAIQYVEGDNNKSFNLKIIQSGEFIGLSSVFSDNTFNYSSIAINDCQAILVERTAITQIISRNGVFGLSLIKRYTEQRMNVFDTLRTVLYKQMTGRIAESLLYIDSFKEANKEIFTLLSRKNIADFAGITTESAVKMLKTLDKEGIIRLQGKDIELLDKDYLNNLRLRG